MNKIPDLPPEHNERPPAFTSRLKRELARIGSLDGKPYFRFMWGQSAEGKRFWREDYYLPYRDHVDKAYALGVPVYGEDGKLAGYSHIYRRGDVIATDAIVETVVTSTEIGIPRYFIELLEYYDREAWEAGRYLDEVGAIHYHEDNTPVDFMGPYPEGGLDYSMVWLCAEHDGCCENVSSASNIGYQADGVRCYGFRRVPNENDVQEMQARWRHFENTVKRADLRDSSVSDAEVVRSTNNRLAAIQAYWDKVQSDVEGDLWQQIKPHEKRLTTDGHGMDLAKYSFVPSNYNEATSGNDAPLVTEK